MIPCPSCGTNNRRGSKFCYFCGQPLDLVFDVNCPACDRLNPEGSAFCAFCGAKIVASPPAEEQLAQPAEELLPSELKGAQATARAERELPPWLYEQPVEHPAPEAPLPHAAPHAAAEPAREQSKYLSDIPGALPKVEGWLSSVATPAGKPAADQAPQSKSKGQAGCLTVAILFLIGLVVLAVL